MDTQTSLTILVVILSVTLAAFLILGIILLVKLIQISNTAKRITDKAEMIADRAEDAVENLSNSTAPMVLARVLGTIMDMGNRKNKEK